MGAGKGEPKEKRSKREMAKAAGKKVLERVMDPKIDEVVDKIDSILQWVFFVLYLQKTQNLF